MARAPRRGASPSRPPTAAGSTAGSLGSAAAPMVSPARPRSVATSRTPAAARATPASCGGARALAERQPDEEGDHRAGGADRRHDAHRADGEGLVEARRWRPRWPGRRAAPATRRAGPASPWPARTTTSAAPTRPTVWLPTITAQRLARRVVEAARGSRRSPSRPTLRGRVRWRAWPEAITTGGTLWRAAALHAAGHCMMPARRHPAQRRRTPRRVRGGDLSRRRPRRAAPERHRQRGAPSPQAHGAHGHLPGAAQPVPQQDGCAAAPAPQAASSSTRRRPRRAGPRGPRARRWSGASAPRRAAPSVKQLRRPPAGEDEAARHGRPSSHFWPWPSWPGSSGACSASAAASSWCRC